MIKEYILASERLTELVRLVNEEMDAASSVYRDEMDTIMSEIGGVEQRLGNLYNAIENGNIEFLSAKTAIAGVKVSTRPVAGTESRT